MSIARSTARPVARPVAYGPASNKWGGGGLSIFVTDGRGEITVPAGAFTLTVNGQDYALNTADIIGQPPVFLEDAEIANDDADTSSSITEGDTLTATAGVFVYDPDGGEPVVAFEWVRDLSTVGTGADHVVAADDITYGLLLHTTATNGFGESDINEVTAIVAAPFSEVGTVWDGSTNKLVRSTALSGVSDSRTALFFFSGYRDASDTDFTNYIQVGLPSGLAFRIFSNQWSALGYDATPTANINMQGGTVAKGQRYSVLVAYDADGTSRLMVFNGTSWSQVASDATGGGVDMNLDVSPVYVGVASNGSYFNGTFYREALWVGITLPDVTDSAVQDLFVDTSTGEIKDPALAVAAYGTPAIDFYGAAAVLNAGTNRGSGGDFVMTGTVTDA